MPALQTLHSQVVRPSSAVDAHLPSSYIVVKLTGLSVRRADDVEGSRCESGAGPLLCSARVPGIYATATSSREGSPVLAMSRKPEDLPASGRFSLPDPGDCPGSRFRLCRYTDPAVGPGPETSFVRPDEEGAGLCYPTPRHLAARLPVRSPWSRCWLLLP